MKRPDMEIARALVNLENNPDFRKVRQWILDSAAEQDMMLRTSDSTHAMYRAQGASKELLGLLEATANPKELATDLAKERAGFNIQSIV